MEKTSSDKSKIFSYQIHSHPSFHILLRAFKKAFLIMHSSIDSKGNTDVECIEIRVSNIDPEEERKLLRKIDLTLLPAIWLMYLLSYMDRTNIGNANVAGMAKDLHLTSSQYFLILVVFFIGYVLFEVPSNVRHLVY